MVKLRSHIMHLKFSGVSFLKPMFPSKYFPKCSYHMSAIFRPVAVPLSWKSPEAKSKSVKEPEQLSKSFKLMVDNGLIKPSSCFGTHHLLPVGLKSMEKLVRLLDFYMTQAQCQKIQMPTLTSAKLWQKTGRLEECGTELMRVEDRHSKQYLLSPTHEEAICELIRSYPLTYRQLPIRLYQITEKFRDEMKPRFGLLRGREFCMKDLYTFDTSIETAKITYNEINAVYEKILNALGLNWVKARGSTGTVGGVQSDEFHIISDIGEDKIIHCTSCNLSFNEDLLEKHENLVSSGTGHITANHVSSTENCIDCGSTSLELKTCIEIGHSFLLGTKYTKALDALYVNEDNKKIGMEMGCYGVGVSRLLAAVIESKSLPEEIRWPLKIAPFVVSIIPPKQGSKEETRGLPLAQKCYEILKNTFPMDVVFDDRTNQTIGKRLQDNKRLGVPFIIAVGKGVHNPQGPMLELHDIESGSISLHSLDELCKRLYDVKSRCI